MIESLFIIPESVIFGAFAIVFVLGTILAYFVISLIGGS
jgi:hypothetical protein